MIWLSWEEDAYCTCMMGLPYSWGDIWFQNWEDNKQDIFSNAIIELALYLYLAKSLQNISVKSEGIKAPSGTDIHAVLCDLSSSACFSGFISGIFFYLFCSWCFCLDATKVAAVSYVLSICIELVEVAMITSAKTDRFNHRRSAARSRTTM